MITQGHSRPDLPTALELEVNKKLQMKQEEIDRKQEEIDRLKTENLELKEQLKQARKWARKISSVCRPIS